MIPSKIVNNLDIMSLVALKCFLSWWMSFYWSPGYCRRKCPDSGWDWSRWRILKVGENYKTGTQDKNPKSSTCPESYCSMNETERMKEAIVCLCHKMSRRFFLTLSEVDTSFVSSSKPVFSLVRSLNPGLWLVKTPLKMLPRGGSSDLKPS